MGVCHHDCEASNAQSTWGYTFASRLTEHAVVSAAAPGKDFIRGTMVSFDNSRRHAKDLKESSEYRESTVAAVLLKGTYSCIAPKRQR